MTQMVHGSVEVLRATMSGPVIGPADPDYDEARRVWNGNIDRRPAMIARCASAADAAAAVTFAVEHDLEITVRGGAHSTSGESVADQLPRKTSPLSALLLYRLDEAYSEAGEDDTAFSGGRSPRFGVFILAVCPTPQLLAADRAWARSFWEALRPHSLSDGSCVNTGSEFEVGRVRAAYGPAKYERLAKIKGKYDPQNLFHHNANIQPA
jgi:hypothetical protein